MRLGESAAREKRSAAHRLASTDGDDTAGSRSADHPLRITPVRESLAFSERPHRRGEEDESSTGTRGTPHGDVRVALMVSPPSGRWLVALGALGSAAATVVIGLLGVAQHPLVIALSFVAVIALFEGVIFVVTTPGRTRWVGAAVAAAGVIAWIWIVIDGDVINSVVAMIVTGLLTTVLTLLALRPFPYRPPAAQVPAPTRPFILMNPRSGGGKVERFDLDGKARKLGAQVVFLERGAEPVIVLQQAVSDGADLLGAAGGDGTQALVAQVAAEHDIPFMCIPAGTRNHFALDLGLDRDDPSLALAALGQDAEEIRIDLGDVGGGPFLNNVSLGAYAEIVARPEYRDAKFNTVMAVLPEVTDPRARSNLAIEAEGRPSIEDPQLVQVANNPYAKRDEPSASGTRPRLDTGMLEVDIVAYKNQTELRALLAAASMGAVERAGAYQRWTGERVRVRSKEGTVRAGVDGESIEFPSPLDISIRPGALRIRLPKDRPGPKTGWPRVDGIVARHLWSIVKAGD
jgi:diacylglycerol kinase family enzyme